MPAGGERAAQERQCGPHVELPRRTGKRVPGNGELEHRDGAAWSHDARELPHGRRGVVDVAKQVRESQSVEARIAEGERFGAALDERDAAVRAGGGNGQHLAALVDAHDRAAESPAELPRHSPGAARDVEDASILPSGDARDEKSAPPGILPEREQAGVTIVRRGKRREEGERGSIALAEDLAHDTIVAAMGLEEDLAAAHAAANAHADPGEQVVGVVPAEPVSNRVYLCAFKSERGQAWLALDRGGEPLTDRGVVRDAVSIAALCELAEESAGGGDLPELRARLAELRATEAPEGIDEAEAAVGELEQVIAAPPRVASLGYLDAIGRAAGQLEEALGSTGGSPFAAAMESGLVAADELADQVERGYKLPFEPATS